ncbi:MAG: aminomethyl-transferring glycine dehydrogenase subunit GcvPA [Solirubrobacterales bacterium]|nr:aminomethyl-transferring glycine dehydrogenase subunit GcvPA [Solirubrobacterales bacterium]
MSGYTSTTDADRAAMLAAIGVDSVEELFDGVPAEVRMDRPLDLPDGLTEAEVYGRMRELASRNADAESEICFLGAGMYDHYVPAIVDAITSRSEFLTPYTPYQPEISQGGLQVMFEFQTAMTELTGLPLSSAGLYEGPSTVAAAAYLAIGATKRRGLVVSQGLHPDSRETVRTYAAGFPADVTEVPLVDGVTDADALAAAIGEDTAAVFVQYPSFVGGVEDLERLAAIAHDAGALLVASCDPIALGILRTPGECGVDIAVGEGQPLGNRLDFGGPSFGFFCATEEQIRRMPGRIAGETTDVDGRRGFVLALQTREQHIRREKATHNICTAQALNALGGIIYLSWLGARGMVELGELLVRRTAYAKGRLAAIDGVELLHDAPVVREFAITFDADVEGVLEHCASRGIAAGVPLDLEYGNGLLIAITEQRTKEHIDLLADALAEAVGAAAAGNGAGGSAEAAVAGGVS